jgi:hypothetical protein
MQKEKEKRDGGRGNTEGQKWGKRKERVREECRR